MIISNISAGLGNQLFQYAFGCHLAVLNKTEHKVDISGYKEIEPDPIRGVRVCGLDNFNITAKQASKEDMVKFNFLLKNKIFRHLIRFYSKPDSYYKRKYILEPEKNYFKFDPCILATKQQNDVYVEGYWQSEKYFKNIENIIRKELSFKEVPDEINSRMIKDIDGSNSVSLHVRHGDNTKMINGVLPLEYYHRAVMEIALKIKDPIFYVFSDDPEWARNNLKLKYPTIYVSHNGDKKNHEDMRLMTHCKHHILGNSTFSWWGAWLGKKEGQIVFSPKSHHSCPNLPSTDYIPANWMFL
ncbi:MAG: alpha-1,2-fucosyltransferase [Patescibacteria group bacterium]